MLRAVSATLVCLQELQVLLGVMAWEHTSHFTLASLGLKLWPATSAAAGGGAAGAGVISLALPTATAA